MAHHRLASARKRDSNVVTDIVHSLFICIINLNYWAFSATQKKKRCAISICPFLFCQKFRVFLVLFLVIIFPMLSVELYLNIPLIYISEALSHTSYALNN